MKLVTKFVKVVTKFVKFKILDKNLWRQTIGQQIGDQFHKFGDQLVFNKCNILCSRLASLPSRVCSKCGPSPWPAIAITIRKLAINFEIVKQTRKRFPFYALFCIALRKCDSASTSGKLKKFFIFFIISLLLPMETALKRAINRLTNTIMIFSYFLVTGRLWNLEKHAFSCF